MSLHIVSLYMGVVPTEICIGRKVMVCLEQISV